MFTAEQARNNKMSNDDLLEEDMQYFYDKISELSKRYNSCRITQQEIDSWKLHAPKYNIIRRLQKLGYEVESEGTYITIRWL